MMTGVSRTTQLLLVTSCVALLLGGASGLPPDFFRTGHSLILKRFGSPRSALGASSRDVTMASLCDHCIKEYVQSVRESCNKNDDEARRICVAAYLLDLEFWLLEQIDLGQAESLDVGEGRADRRRRS